MTKDTGLGSGIWSDARKVRVTKGKVEAPVRANGTDGIQIGSYKLPASSPKPAGERKPGLLARLFARLSKRR
ncbi:hypothetical protein ACOACQ_04695 [Nocardioides sp. CPCC 206347]|jgi:hypothetical protein|uniref:hypothetical protein n=1 Tax=unclassified Nocardioides TaxID=2615069 RepID=UPI0036127B07